MASTRANLLIVIAFFSPILSYAQQELPIWVVSPPKQTSEYKYYVGSSSKASSHGEAIQNASKVAIEQAIRENFGTSSKISSESYESTLGASSTFRFSEDSKLINLNGFETKDSFVVQDKNEFSAYILFSFKISEIEIEKSRLKKISTNLKPEIVFSEVGNVSQLSKGKLEIITQPDLATITIDGKEAITKTPIRMIGIISPGEHSIVIDHPEYETIQESFIMNPGASVLINKILVPATGALVIDSEPSGASVLINGQHFGFTPAKIFSIPANKIHKIVLIHKEAYQTLIETTIAKNETRIIKEKLRLKAAKLQIVTSPLNSKITIDNNVVERGWNTITPGEHTIDISAEGYQSKSIKVQLAGDQHKIENVKLTALSEIEKLEFEEGLRKKNYPWYFGYGFSSWGKTAVEGFSPSGIFYFSLEKVFLKQLAGIKIEADFIGAGDSDTKTNSMSGSFKGISLPIYYSDFYLGPKIGRLSQSIKCFQSQCNSREIILDGEGAEFGYFLNSQELNLGLNFNYNFLRIHDQKNIEPTINTNVFRVVVTYKF